MKQASESTHRRRTELVQPSTQIVGAATLRKLDAAMSSIAAPLDLAATLDALVAAFVPRHVAGAYVTLFDEHGDARIAAARFVDGAVPYGAHATAGVPDGLRLPLCLDGTEMGAIHLCAAADAPPLSRDVLALAHAIAVRSAPAIRNARRFEHERSVALAFQHAALVSDLPRVPGYRFDAIYQAGRAEALVGGDWYDAFELRDGRIVVSIGDVVGSGLDAAITMMTVRQTIRGVAEVHPDPVLMLQAADRTLRAQHPERFVTAFVGVIDTVTQQCSFANAGHPSPRIRLAGGAIRQTHGHGFPLGLGFEQTIEVAHVTMPPGSMLVLFTDGLIESTRDIEEGERRLDAALRDPEFALADDPAARLHRSVLGGDASDDVAILAVTIESGPPVRRWRFDPAWNDVTYRVRRELCHELTTSGYPGESLRDVEVIFSEAVSNLVRYAPGTAEVLLESGAGRFVMHVLDKGPGFEFNPRLPPDLYSEYGRGLFLMSRLAHDLVVERRPGGGSHARVVL